MQHCLASCLHSLISISLPFSSSTSWLQCLQSRALKHFFYVPQYKSIQVIRATPVANAMSRHVKELAQTEHKWALKVCVPVTPKCKEQEYGWGQHLNSKVASSLHNPRVGKGMQTKYRTVGAQAVLGSSWQTTRIHWSRKAWVWTLLWSYLSLRENYLQNKICKFSLDLFWHKAVSCSPSFSSSKQQDSSCDNLCLQALSKIWQIDFRCWACFGAGCQIFWLKKT